MFATKTRFSLLLYLVTIAIFVAGVQPCSAQVFKKAGPKRIPSWYLAFAGQVNFVPDSTFIERGGPSPQSGTLELDEGYGFNVAIGYRPRYTGSVWDNIRIEGELGLLDNEIDQMVVAGQGIQLINGDIQALKMMLNGYIDFDATQQIRPYIGGGLGAARIYTENDEDTVFAYQGMAGLTYIPTTFPAAELNVGYRYFGTSDPKMTTPGTGSQVEFEYDSHIAEAGVRLYF